MKSKIVTSVLSVIILTSFSGCGKDCQPDRPKPESPPVHYDGWAKMTYIDVDSGIRKNVQVGLTKSQYDYIGADVVSLPANLPETVSIEADLPQTSAEHSWEYLPVIGIDGQPPSVALHDSSRLTTNSDGKVYSTDLIRVRTTLPTGAITGVFRIEMVQDVPADVVQTIQVRFQKPSLQ